MSTHPIRTAAFTEYEDAEKVLNSLVGHLDADLKPDWPGRIANEDGTDWIQIVNYGAFWFLMQPDGCGMETVPDPQDLADWLATFDAEDFKGHLLAGNFFHASEKGGQG